MTMIYQPPTGPSSRSFTSERPARWTTRKGDRSSRCFTTTLRPIGWRTSHLPGFQFIQHHKRHTLLTASLGFTTPKRAGASSFSALRVLPFHPPITPPSSYRVRRVPSLAELQLISLSARRACGESLMPKSPPSSKPFGNWENWGQAEKSNKIVDSLNAF